MNRRFQFRLERIKRIRALEERIARAEWGEALDGALRVMLHGVEERGKS